MADQQAGAAGGSGPLRPHWSKRFWAALLSFFIPGLGQIFAGRYRRGAAFLLAILVAVLIIKASALLWPRGSAAVMPLIAVAVLLVALTVVWAVIDAWRVARQRPVVRLRWRMRCAIYAAFFVGWFVTDALLLTGPRWRAFSVPSESMLPTLEIGDDFYVRVGYFRDHEPQRGDLVVFRLPCDYSLLDPAVAAQERSHCDPSVEFVKRIIGLPGDRVQLRKGVVYLNDAPLARQSIGSFTYATFADDTPTGYPEFEETAPGGARYRVILSPGGDRDLDDTDLFAVPPGRYFVLGDNRDDSADSRDPASGVGFVPRDSLVGKAALIYFSRDGRLTLRPNSGGSPAIRWERLGLPLQ